MKRLRIWLLGGLLGCLLLSVSSAWAAPHYKVVLLLYRGVTPAEQGFMDTLRAQLPVDFTILDAGEQQARLPELVKQARALRPDLIYTFGTSVTLAAVGPSGSKDPRYIRDIPVVCNIVADPVGARLTPSMTSSARNLTGVTHLVPMVDQLRAVASWGKIRRLGVLYSPQESNSQLAVQQLRAQSSAFGYVLYPVAIQDPGKAALAAAVQRLAAQKVDYLYLPSDSSLIRQADAIVAPALAAGIPVVSATEEPIRREGALFGLVGNYRNAGSFAAYKAVQILREHKAPAAIPFQPLKRFALLINMRSAKQLQRYPPLEQFRFAELLD
jgi:putative ABC transport system substrate-binding protein